VPSSDRKPLLLDFEKPLAELETRIHQIRELAAENSVDVTDEIRKLEARSAQLRQEIFSSLSPMQRLQLAAPVPSITFRQLATSGSSSTAIGAAETTRPSSVELPA